MVSVFSVALCVNVPPFGSNVIVQTFGVHIAYSTIFPEETIFFTFALALYCVPPVVSVPHFEN